MKRFSNIYPLKSFYSSFSLLFGLHSIIRLSTFRILFHTICTGSNCKSRILKLRGGVVGYTPLIISGLGLEDEAVAGDFYPKDSQGLQNLGQVELKDSCM